MFYEVEKFPFLIDIKASLDVIWKELNCAVEKNETVRRLLDLNDELLDHYTHYWVFDNGFHTVQTGIDIREGEYMAAAVFKKGFPIKHFDAEELFPKTLELLKKVEGVEFAGFFKLGKNSRAIPHTHTRRHLVFHMLLHDLEAGDYIVRVGDETRKFRKKGDCLAFDYSVEHEAYNTSSAVERINLLIDFKPDFLSSEKKS